MKTELKIGRYANILMDRWFKRTFGREQAKRLMQLFLQTLIPDREIAEISYEAQEHVNTSEADGKDIRLDVQCRDANGNLFIVEVQLLPQDTFYERAVYNSALVIQEQVPGGARDWDFAPVYFIGVLNFSLHRNTDQVLFRYRLREDTTLDTMTDRIQYLFLEVPNCTKALTDDAQTLDNLCYALGNIAELEERPPQMEGELFELLFNSAEIRNFAPRERNEIHQRNGNRTRQNKPACLRGKERNGERNSARLGNCGKSYAGQGDANRGNRLFDRPFRKRDSSAVTRLVNALYRRVACGLPVGVLGGCGALNVPFFGTSAAF